MTDHNGQVDTDNREHGQSPRATRRGPGRVEIALAVTALVVSAVVLVSLSLARPASHKTPQTWSPPSEATTERGDPALAQKLADQARRESGNDAQAALRLLLAAHIVAPDRVEHRHALAQETLSGVEPAVSVTANTGDAPIDYAALSADASFLVTSGPKGASLWQIRSLVPPDRLRAAGSLGEAVTDAAGVGTLLRTTLVTTGGAGAFVWRAATPATVVRLGPLGTRITTVAVSGDGQNAVTVQDTTATVWNLAGLRPLAQVTFAYDRAVSTLAFAPGSTMVLAAGHADGVTVHTIDLDSASTTTRKLTGIGAVDAVAVSENASTLAAVSAEGTLSVWSLRSQEPQPSGTTRGAFGPGPHRLWLSQTGDYAFVSNPSGAPSIWSLADPARPTQLMTLNTDSDQDVPAMISGDGTTVATISRSNTATIWNIQPIVEVITDPVSRACELVDLTEQQWRDMVPDNAYANPCAPPTLPTLRVDQ